MKVGRTRPRGTGTAGSPGALVRRAAGRALLAGLGALAAGCGGGGVAVAPVQSPIESALPGRDSGYVVGSGDTLYSIAWRFGIDYRTLAAANSIRDPYTIYPGQRLVVPEPGDDVAPEPPAAAAAAQTEPGETSVRGAGTTGEPEVAPLPPPPEPAPASTESPAAAPQDAPAAAPQDAPAAAPPVAKAEPKSAAPASTAARTVAGMRWIRPTNGKTVSTFGRGGNKGIDIGGTFEQPIHAAAPGRVVYAGSGLIGYGKLVIVKHDSRLLSAYAHNERLHVGEGDAVSGGEHIADMGRSSKGRVMLHFEIRHNGKPVDPLRYIP